MASEGKKRKPNWTDEEMKRKTGRGPPPEAYFKSWELDILSIIPEELISGVLIEVKEKRVQVEERKAEALERIATALEKRIT
ncbi:uncharacterized protein LOC144621224 [Crassostrea virginica]